MDSPARCIPQKANLAFSEVFQIIYLKNEDSTYFCAVF
jgi:hypothetical protein